MPADRYGAGIHNFWDSTDVADARKNTAIWHANGYTERAVEVVLLSDLVLQTIGLRVIAGT
ncbi:hypothetical protein D3C72_2192210 [compost metagenome]